MTRGLVIGKFLPPHKGHLALIEFAAQQCDELIVSLSFTNHDAIPAELRVQWLKELLKNKPSVKVFQVIDDFDREDLPLEERTLIWADFIRSTYPKIDVIISSEPYGEPFARHLEASHISFDPQRSGIPVSGTLIRENPYQHWRFIPDPVKPFFTKKICFYGPESTGKTSMTEKMAKHFDTAFVPEVAREMLTSNNFSMDFIRQIGRAQTKRVLDKLQLGHQVLFCDTDLITTQIYCRHYLGSVPDELYALERQIQYHHYFLFDIDVPWVEDGLRDLGHLRQEMFDIFKRELDNRKLPYTLVQGNYQQREKFVLAKINELLQAPFFPRGIR